MIAKKRTLKINQGYFSLSSKMEDVKYFMRQGHTISHLISRFKWYLCPKYFIATRFPTHIDIETSSICQMRCPMCRTTEMRKKGMDFAGVMDLELYKKIINQCADESVYSVKLSWRGEPLLNPNIREMVLYAKKKGIKDVAFLSNGERLNPELIEKLVDAGLDWISISIDGIDDVYNKIRKPALFKDILENIKYLRLYRRKLGFIKPLVRVQSIHSAIIGRELEFLCRMKRFADRVNFIADQKRTIDENDYLHNKEYICPSPWQRMVISWNGKVVQCCEDYMEGNVLGDVRKERLKEIWNGRKFKELRRLMKDGKRLCTSPCRICADGGITEKININIGRKHVRLMRYGRKEIE